MRCCGEGALRGCCGVGVLVGVEEVCGQQRRGLVSSSGGGAWAATEEVCDLLRRGRVKWRRRVACSCTHASNRCFPNERRGNSAEVGCKKECFV